MTQMADSTRKGVAFALATALVGSTSAAAGKLMAAELPATVIVFIQSAICFAVILPAMLSRGGIHSLASAHWKTHLLRGLGGWLSFYTFYTALAGIPLVDATLLRNTAPLMVPLVIWLWVGLLVPRSRWLPLITGFIGIAIILRPRPEIQGLSLFYLVGLSSGLLLAVSMVGTRLLSRHETSGKILLYYFGLSFVLSLPLALLDWQPIAPRSWPYLLYIGFSIFLAMWLYTKAYSYAKPSIVSPISYFSVVFAGLIGWWVWGHVPAPLTFIGIAVVVLAGAITVYLGSKEPAP